jgi:hypothetical protein
MPVRGVHTTQVLKAVTSWSHAKLTAALLLSTPAAKSQHPLTTLWTVCPSPQHTPRHWAAACIQWKRPLLLSHKTIYAGNTTTLIPASLQGQYVLPPGQKAHMQEPEIPSSQSINHPHNPAPRIAVPQHNLHKRRYRELASSAKPGTE